MPRKQCVHPIAALKQISPIGPQIMCRLCKHVMQLPNELRTPSPSSALVQSVAGFLKYIGEANDAGAQINPRAELALILSMSDALHALKDSGPQD